MAAAPGRRAALPFEPGSVGTCQQRRADGSVCGAVLDVKGRHARSCKAGGWVVRKHDAVVAELEKWCEDQNCYVQREAILPQANPDRPVARIDLIAHLAGHALI